MKSLVRLPGAVLASRSSIGGEVVEHGVGPFDVVLQVAQHLEHARASIQTVGMPSAVGCFVPMSGPNRCRRSSTGSANGPAAQGRRFRRLPGPARSRVGHLLRSVPGRLPGRLPAGVDGILRHSMRLSRTCLRVRLHPAS